VAADEAVLNKVCKKKKIPKNPPFKISKVQHAVLSANRLFDKFLAFSPCFRTVACYTLGKCITRDASFGLAQVADKLTYKYREKQGKL
jgi:hypothetical protein